MPGKALLVLFFLASVSSYFSLQVNANKYSKIPNWLKSSSRLCRKCQAGSYMIRKCDANHGTLCAPCPARTFTDRSNKMHHCTPCGTCNSNQMVVSLCTRRKDIVCKRVYSAKKFHLHNLRGFQGDQPIGQQKIMEAGSGSMLMSDSNIFGRTFQNAPAGDVKFELGSLHKIEKIPEAGETSGDDRIKPSLFMNDLDFDKTLDNDTAYPSSLDPNYNGKDPNPEKVPIHAIPSKFAQEEDLIPITASTKDRNGGSFSAQKSGSTTRAPSERQKRKGKKEKKKKRILEEGGSFGGKKSIKEAKMFRSLDGDILSTVYKAPNKEDETKAESKNTALIPDQESVTTFSPDMDNANVTLKPDTDLLPTGTQVPDTEQADTEPEVKTTTPKETEKNDEEYKVQLNSEKEEPSVQTNTETSTVKDFAKETHTILETDKSTTIHGLLLPENVATAANDSTLALQDTEPNHFNSTGVVLGSVFTIIALIIVFLVILHLCGKKRNTKDMRDHIKIEITDATEMVPMSNNDGVTNKTNVEANGQCPENGGPSALLNNDFTCAVNDNYRPVSPTDTEPTNGPIVEDVYDIPENLRRKTQQQQQRRQEQQQKEQQQQQQQPTSNENTDDGETKKLVPPPVFRLDQIEGLKYIDDSEDDMLFPDQSDEEDYGNRESDDNDDSNERRKLLKTNSGGFTATFLLN